MPRSLPPVPSIQQLKNQAKDLLAAHKGGDVHTCEAFRRIHRYSELPTQEILKTRMSLQDAQFAVALEYGFKSWKELKECVEAIRAKEILIVDDERVILEVLDKMIRKYLPELSAFPIATAIDGVEALQHINRQTPLFLILGMIMPRKGGDEVLQELSHRDEVFPILVMSGYIACVTSSNREAKELVAEMGKIPEDRFEFLGKPIKPEDLVSVIRSWNLLGR